MAFDVMVDGRLEALALSVVNSFLWITKETTATGLDFDNDQRTAFLRNDIEVVVA